jgi:hypothetical protein
MNTSMTVRNIASVVGVGKSSVSRILYKDSGALSPNRKGKCGRKRKTLLLLISFY